MEFDQDALISMAADIWASMLGIDLEPGNGSMERLALEPTITGCVQITGGWAGAVTVRCPTEAAKRLAGVMFDCRPDDLSMDEVRDAIGELTNMTGGSVKGLVPADCQLGIPAVAEGIDYSLTLPRAEAVNSLAFEWDGLPLEVVVYQTAA